MGPGGLAQALQVTYSQQVPPDASQRVPLQQQHLQVSQQAQGRRQAGGAGGDRRSFNWA